jgi:hypothetical protein
MYKAGQHQAILVLSNIDYPAIRSYLILCLQCSNAACTENSAMKTVSSVIAMNSLMKSIFFVFRGTGNGWSPDACAMNKLLVKGMPPLPTN